MDAIFDYKTYTMDYYGLTKEGGEVFIQETRIPNTKLVQ